MPAATRPCRDGLLTGRHSLTPVLRLSLHDRIPFATELLTAFISSAPRRTAKSGSTAIRSPSSAATACWCSTPTARHRPPPRCSRKSGRSRSQPVRYVVNSHWHWDHWYGTEVYTQAFPDVKVIAHEKTRMMMAGPAIEFNRPGLESQLPGYLAAARAAHREGRSRHAAAAELAQAEAGARRRAVLSRTEEQRAPHAAEPDLTDTLTLQLGDREIQVRHHDRAVTPGDTFLYLPKEKIVDHRRPAGEPGLVCAELVSRPAGCKTLEYIDSLDAAMIVPGHGEPLRDETAAAGDDRRVPRADRSAAPTRRRAAWIPIPRARRSCRRSKS